MVNYFDRRVCTAPIVALLYVFIYRLLGPVPPLQSDPLSLVGASQKIKQLQERVSLRKLATKKEKEWIIPNFDQVFALNHAGYLLDRLSSEGDKRRVFGPLDNLHGKGDRFSNDMIQNREV